MKNVLLIGFFCLITAAMPSRVTDAAQPLRMVLTAPPSCEADYDEREVAPTLNVEWWVTGGAAPYSVVVAGQRYSGASGVAAIICGIWDSDNPDDLDSGVMTIQGRVSDSSSAGATATTYVYAVRVVRLDHINNYRDTILAPGQTYRVHGALLTVPDEFEARVVDYVSGDCSIGDSECDDYFSLSGAMLKSSFVVALGRWSGAELWRRVEPIYGIERLTAAETAAVNAVLDQLVASIGQPRPASLLPAGVSASDVSDLAISMRAPAICETHWGSYGGRRQSIEVEWQVDGGVAPYQVQFADQTFESSQGVLTIPCGSATADRYGVDSQLMTTQAIVTDATGAVTSGIVNTYAIAAGRFGDNRLRGGWTHRMQGLLMTIPDGLEFDVSTIGIEEVECGENTCTHAGCLDSGMPICESSWSMRTTKGSVSVAFGYVTRSMFWRSVNASRIADDPGVNVESPAEVERLLDQLAASVGEPPQLPGDGVFDPAPLRITAWAAPVACTGRVYQGGWRDGFAQRRVSGGYWWPLGVGSEAWDDDKHRQVQLPCPTRFGWHSQTLEVHEGGPNPASAETTVTHFTPPQISDGVLIVQAGTSGGATSYCPPGGQRRITWYIYGGVGPYHATLNGVEVELDHRFSDTSASGEATVECLNGIGLQAATLDVRDSSNPVHRTIHPIILSIVTEHPSGRPWSDFD